VSTAAQSENIIGRNKSELEKCWADACKVLGYIGNSVSDIREIIKGRVIRQQRQQKNAISRRSR
jgi:hypothetical protein